MPDHNHSRVTTANREPPTKETVGECEVGVMWENGIESCKLSYVKRITSPGLMHDTGCSGLMHWDDPEGWEGDSGWGTHVQLWLIHVNVWQKPPRYCN